jgi:hypothetical protein
VTVRRTGILERLHAHAEVVLAEAVVGEPDLERERAQRVPQRLWHLGLAAAASHARVKASGPVVVSE